MAERMTPAASVRIALCAWLITWLIDVWPKGHETQPAAMELTTKLLGLLGAEMPEGRAHG